MVIFLDSSDISDDLCLSIVTSSALLMIFARQSSHHHQKGSAKRKGFVRPCFFLAPKGEVSCKEFFVKKRPERVVPHKTLSPHTPHTALLHTPRGHGSDLRRRLIITAHPAGGTAGRGARRRAYAERAAEPGASPFSHPRRVGSPQVPHAP